uniref:Uncharacterized protein n=1 Tax=viral metagenome TaxID=1070528 RepID=A0A6C0KG48_9ZZZZ
MGLTQSEQQVLARYAEDKATVESTKTKFADALSQLGKASRFLREQVLGIMLAHAVELCWCDVAGVRVQLSVVQSKRRMPPTGVGIMDIVRSLGPDDLSLRGAQMKANGEAARTSQVLTSVVQDKMKTNFTQSKPEVKLSTKTCNKAEKAPFTTDESCIVADLYGVHKRLAVVKADKKKEMDEASRRLKVTEEHICDILARTGTLIHDHHGQMLIFQIKRNSVPSSMSGEELGSYLLSLFTQLVPDTEAIGPGRTLEKLKGAEQLNQIARSYQDTVDGNYEEKIEFTYCSYAR